MSSLLPWCGIELIDAQGQIYYQRNKLSEKEPLQNKTRYVPTQQTTPIRILNKDGGKVVIYGPLE